MNNLATILDFLSLLATQLTPAIIAWLKQFKDATAQHIMTMRIKRCLRRIRKFHFDDKLIGEEVKVMFNDCPQLQGEITNLLIVEKNGKK